MNPIKLFVCGDIVNMSSDSQFIDDKLINHIKDSDYAICNFEGTCEYPRIKGLSMVQCEGTLRLLQEAGFDMMLLANNHVTDYGYLGLRNTIREIEENGFAHIGAGFDYDDTYRPFLIDISGITLGFINLCEAQVGHFSDESQEYGYAWIGDKRVDDRIKDLRKRCDVLILFAHAGLENYRLPLPQFRSLYRHYIDTGVDLVIGGHPHIAQGIEQWCGKYIFYSLGNFYFPFKTRWENTWKKGFSVVLTIDGNLAIGFDIIQHKLVDDKVVLCNEDILNISELNNSLNDSNYLTEIVHQNKQSFYDLPYRLYKDALNGTSENDTFDRKIKNILCYLVNRKKTYKGSESFRMSLLKRLVENETYRFLTINYINDLESENERGNK